ncbi:hypothetical protein ACFE04_013814 [Oxalis oulophora]
MENPRKMRERRRTDSWSEIGSVIGGGEEFNTPRDARSITQDSEQPSSPRQGEKIFVSVRVRPLNEKELSRNEIFDWECINNDTIIYKNSLVERSMYPAAYSFDKVFGIDSSTKKVYEEAAKEVALSVINGINSSIFAYGQTSSGKTYTMCGVTEHAVDDIYDYVEKNDEREFVLKFSAIEIYNEAVRDLLSSDSTPLRLLDDPERGTVVEKLTEEILEGKSHLLELLSICEAQRHIGETSMNETSSRSHQILRLTVESSARSYRGAGSSSTLTANVDDLRVLMQNFIDLAGSERASQTLSAGVRLKEGSHINRSLLTLGTVIRKLSKGKNGHVPYRDSKLTRILQNSLGGNARTAIICTMSPARTHVEQSRNTLLFASCAKEVNTNAHVNVVMSDKALVKQLQKELARLESEMKSLGSAPISRDSTALLKEKELQIEKMDKEIKELTQQRDAAQTWVENLLRSSGENRFPRLDEQTNEASPHATKCMLQYTENVDDNFLLDDSTPKFVGLDPCEDWENISERNNRAYENGRHDVQGNQVEDLSPNKKTEVDALSRSLDENVEKSSMTIAIKSEDTLAEEQQASNPNSPYPQMGDNKESDAISSGETYDVLKQKMQEMQNTINYLVALYPLEQSPCHSEMDTSSSCSSLSLPRSRSCKARLSNIASPNWHERESPINPRQEVGMYRKLSEIKSSASSKNLPRKNHSFSSAEAHNFRESRRENLPPTGSYHEKLSEQNFDLNIGNLSRKYSQASLSSTDSMSMKDSDGDDSVSYCGSTFTSMEMTEHRSEKEPAGSMVGGATPSTYTPWQSGNAWATNFGNQRGEIIELWAACNVPLLHRTYFFLLFKGDPSDSVYLEVELRRLYFLKETFSRGTRTLIDSQTVTKASSLKALNRERALLCKKIQKKFPSKDREGLYQKWGIGLKSRQRSLQLAHKIWTDTKDIEHIKKSAALVAKLVGFIEPGQVPKEIFGLTFLPRQLTGWKTIMSPLMSPVL